MCTRGFDWLVPAESGPREIDYHDNRRAQWEAQTAPFVMGGEGQSLGTKDILSIGPVDTH